MIVFKKRLGLYEFFGLVLFILGFLVIQLPNDGLNGLYNFVTFVLAVVLSGTGLYMTIDWKEMEKSWEEDEDEEE